MGALNSLLDCFSLESIYKFRCRTIQHPHTMSTSLSAPALARFHVSRTPAPSAQSILTTNINPTDNFGYTFSLSRTHESRHEQSLVDAQSPPPYIAQDADLPPYARKAPEPITLAKYLFKFGFCTRSPFFHIPN